MKNWILICLIALPFSLLAAPKWTSGKLCNEKEEICAVGEGESLNFSKQAARAEILKFFETKLSAKFESELSSVGKTISESSRESIEETTEGVISGIEIRKTDEDKTSFYALGVLNKRKAAKSFEREIEKIDNKVKVLFENKENTYKVEDLFIERELLSKRLSLLTGRDKKSPISFLEIFKARKEMTKGVIIKLSFTEERPLNIKAILERVIGDLGYKISKEGYTHIVKGSFYPEKMYLNVDGFEKYKFIVKVQSEDKAGVVKSTLTESFVGVGRGFSQAYGKIEGSVEKYLSDNIKKMDFK